MYTKEGDNINSILKNSSIKRYRQFAGYTQKSLSSELNIPLSTYRQKEQGRTSFSDNEKEKIKAIFSRKIGRVTIDDIFFN
ncbi:helix-turn-helix transcriptional regulator [Apilactobacillus micheneri]|uniref:helix-turn-helix transcriptional regulator n=1 Tax=Apilactobacillus micheneri TaxID=1899430 RepID=UPI001CDC76FA|nr:helix-turn-helix transcriptional regulator [Apilactobacillus micheneri]